MDHKDHPSQNKTPVSKHRTSRPSAINPKNFHKNQNTPRSRNRQHLVDSHAKPHHLPSNPHNPPIQPGSLLMHLQQPQHPPPLRIPHLPHNFKRHTSPKTTPTLAPLLAMMPNNLLIPMKSFQPNQKIIPALRISLDLNLDVAITDIDSR